MGVAVSNSRFVPLRSGHGWGAAMSGRTKSANPNAPPALPGGFFTRPGFSRYNPGHAWIFWLSHAPTLPLAQEDRFTAATPPGARGNRPCRRQLDIDRASPRWPTGCWSICATMSACLSGAADWGFHFAKPSASREHRIPDDDRASRDAWGTTWTRGAAETWTISGTDHTGARRMFIIALSATMAATRRLPPARIRPGRARARAQPPRVFSCRRQAAA